MKLHWLVKYYFFGFIIIFGSVYLLESSEPFVNWTLYPEVSEQDVKKLIQNKECTTLNQLYTDELETNYNKNYFGYLIRKDKKSVKGLNLIKYLNYHIKKSCN